MEPLKIIKNIYEEQGIEGSLDVRVTMTHKGIKVNFGLGTDSNKPSTFNLNDAIIQSAQISKSQIERWMKSYRDNELDLRWRQTKMLKFFSTVIERLSPKPMTPDVDHRIPGAGC